MYKYPKHCIAERQATVAPLVSPFVCVRFRATIPHSLTCLHSFVCYLSLAVRYRLYPSPLAKPSANPYIPLSSSPANPSVFRSSRTHTSGGGDNKSRPPVVYSSVRSHIGARERNCGFALSSSFSNSYLYPLSPDLMTLCLYPCLSWGLFSSPGLQT